MKNPAGVCEGSDTFNPLSSVIEAVEEVYPFIDAAVANTQ